MDTEREGILEVLKRDPEHTKLMLKFAFLGPVVIIAWEWGSELFLPALGALLLNLLLILLYAGGLTYFIARIVQTATRWEIGATKQAERLTLNRRRGEGPEALPQPIFQTGFHESYFLLRLHDEVRQARRQGGVLSVVALEVTLPDEKLTPKVVERVNLELARLVASQSQMISLSLSASETEVVFSLPNMDSKEAKAYVSKVVQGLGTYWCHFGIVSYPENFTDSDKLFIGAREACEASRKDKSPSPRRSAAIA